jgi:hypothetical protein
MDQSTSSDRYVTPERDSTEKAIYAAAGFAIAGLVGLCMRFLMHKRDEDDRPPILVRDGSVHIEQTPVPGEADVPEWVGDGDNWRPDHPNGREIHRFLVSVTDPRSGSCKKLTGNTVRIFRDSSPPIHFVVAGGEPKVGPKGILTKDPSVARLLKASGRPKEVQVGGHTCMLSEDAVVWIWPIP